MDQKKQKFASILVNKVYQLKEGETLIITFDSYSDKELIDILLEESRLAGGMAAALQIAQADTACAGTNPFIPLELWKSMIAKADCWLDASRMLWLYSDAFEYAMTLKTIRYMLIGDMEMDGLLKLFDVDDFEAMIRLSCNLRDLMLGSKEIRVCNPRGTDFTFLMEPRHVLLADNGDASTPGFFTPPACVNIIPNLTSSAGTMVFDAAMIAAHWEVLKQPLTFTVKDGAFTETKGDPALTNKLEAYLREKGDANSRKVGHIMIGLSPNIREFENEVIYDERLYGGITIGFGNVSSADAPPDGLPSTTHFDCVIPDVSLWVDGKQLMEDGRFIHPDLKPYDDRLRALKAK